MNVYNSLLNQLIYNKMTFILIYNGWDVDKKQIKYIHLNYGNI